MEANTRNDRVSLSHPLALHVWNPIGRKGRIYAECTKRQPAYDRRPDTPYSFHDLPSIKSAHFGGDVMGFLRH